MAFEQNELWLCANERIPWHENLGGEEAIQNRVHELVIFNRSELKSYLKNRLFEPNILSLMIRLVSVGNLEGAVSLLLSTSPDSSYFYPNALRAVALSTSVSKSLVELAVKVLRLFFFF